MEKVCHRLKSEDFVPNLKILEVTLKEAIEKDRRGEGFVEFISCHKKVKSKTMYLVKWVGFTAQSWENSRRSLVYCCRRRNIWKKIRTR